MEIRKTNLGVEYELSVYETGRSSVKVLAYFPNSVEQESFEIKGLTKQEVERADEADDVSFLTDEQLPEAQQYINEQAIMYVSMELAKLMGEGKCTSYTLDLCNGIGIVAIQKNGVYRHTNGLPQIEELIKQIRYSK